MVSVSTLAGLVIILLFLYSGLKVVREYERLVVFRLGHLLGVRGPGLVIVIPGIDSFVRVSLRVVTLDVPVQEVITRDNVTCRVNAVVYYRVVDASRSVVSVENADLATAQLAQTTLRSVVGRAELDQLLAEREKLNVELQRILDEGTDPWGIKVTAVEIKDVVLAESLQRAIAKQAEAERARRAIVLQAEGEREAAERLAEAADILSRQGGGLMIRMMRMLGEVSNAQGSVVVIPVPMEFLRLLDGRPGKPSD